MTNLVSNSGVVGTDVTGVGTVRNSLAATGMVVIKLFLVMVNVSSGATTSITNLVSNTGVVASDTTGVGTAR
jgi:hypothetical protein